MAVKCQNALKSRKFLSFLGMVSIDKGQGRQFVSQLGALAVEGSLMANSRCPKSPATDTDVCKL
jgi:hypothetical protein